MINFVGFLIAVSHIGTVDRVENNLAHVVFAIEELGNIELGELMQWKLNVSNVGDFEFNGMILCDLNGDDFYSEAKSIGMNSSIDVILETYPVKGVLTCSHNGT